MRKTEKMICFLNLLTFLLSSYVLASSGFSNLPVLTFDDGYTQLFGGDNLTPLADGRSVHLALDQRSGSGFVSHDLYLHGFFSASIKLPADYTAGVVVAFYMSNGDVFDKTHDELDFEFLGNIRGREWRVQTNVYGNGSTSTGREERYGLWFDPSEDFHQYSILWTDDAIIFFIDDVPIREVRKNSGIGSDFPAKPMSMFATIWDGSTWATLGGRYKVNYKYAPYISEFTDFILHGCAVDPLELSPSCNQEEIESVKSIIKMQGLSSSTRLKMEKFRKKHMQYSYCYDRRRYLRPPSECIIDPLEKNLLLASSGFKVGNVHMPHRKRQQRGRPKKSQSSF